LNAPADPAAVPPVERIALDVALSRYHDSSYYIASIGAGDGIVPFPIWCYRITQLVLRRPIVMVAASPGAPAVPGAISQTVAGSGIIAGGGWSIVFRPNRVVAQMGDSLFQIGKLSTGSLPTLPIPPAALEQQIALAFDIPLNKDVVRRILAARYQPTPNSSGPSWLTVLGHAKGRLWSVDLFRCESALLRVHWVLVVMDQFTRRIVGFGVHRGAVDGVALCRMFNRAARGQPPPKYLSSDHDRLFQFHQWQATLRILDVEEIKTVPYVPLSHPFVERLIGTIRRECLDRTLFWTAADLEAKLLAFQRYYNGHRVHAQLEGCPPEAIADVGRIGPSLHSYRWQSHCGGLFHTPIAA
jgi:transposase InsO family protein